MDCPFQRNRLNHFENEIGIISKGLDYSIFMAEKEYFDDECALFIECPVALPSYVILFLPMSYTTPYKIINVYLKQ